MQKLGFLTACPTPKPAIHNLLGMLVWEGRWDEVCAGLRDPGNAEKLHTT